MCLFQLLSDLNGGWSGDGVRGLVGYCGKEMTNRGRILGFGLDGKMKVKLAALLGNHERNYDRQTNRQTDRPPGRRAVSASNKLDVT